MARRVFFSFYYERDIWRANVVRNCWMTHDDRQSAGFWDASLWEDAKLHGDDAVRRLIDRGLENTSVTAVLYGAETSSRPWVRYEIEQSRRRGNGMLAISISNIKDRNGYTDIPGTNPFSTFYLEGSILQPRRYFTQLYNSYDWANDGGYAHLGRWVDEAARAAGR
jgi:hypothetical protein